VVETGQDQVRAWYSSPDVPTPGITAEATANIEYQAAQRRKIAFPPTDRVFERGAVLCRVSPSFFRFAHLEWFAKRKKMRELTMLMDHVIDREYPSISCVSDGSSMGKHKTAAERYVRLYSRIVEASALLVAEWLRVGYVHGNMNSDNTMLGGRTIDFGPFAFMEKFDPEFQPFTSDRSKNFGFCNQMKAMQLNVSVLGTTAFKPVIQHLYDLHEQEVRSHSGPSGNPSGHHDFSSQDKIKFVMEIDDCAKTIFATTFGARFKEIRRAKLGFSTWNRGDEETWDELESLLERFEPSESAFDCLIGQ
jgi:uncharacterized protein YdiU (UPF0061 family)